MTASRAATAAWLTALAERGKRQYAVHDRTVGELHALGAKVRDQAEVHGNMQFKLAQFAQNALRLWVREDEARTTLLAWAATAHAVTEARAEAQAGLQAAAAAAQAVYGAQLDAVGWLLQRGEAATNYVFRSEDAVEQLLIAGATAVRHRVELQLARSWLRARVVKIRSQFQTVRDASAFLAERGRLAEKHGDAVLAARRALTATVESARNAVANRGQARMYLEARVSESRKVALMAALAKAHKKRVAELEKEIKDRDKQRAARQKGLEMTEAEKQKDEMKLAFAAYDLDGSGEIDLLEFRALLRGKVPLVKIPPAEVDDCFRMIDNNGSGGVSFDEFYRWFNFEKKKGRVKKKGLVTIADVLPLRDRAVRALLVLHNAGELGEAAAAEAPAAATAAAKAAA